MIEFAYGNKDRKVSPLSPYVEGKGKGKLEIFIPKQ